MHRDRIHALLQSKHYNPPKKHEKQHRQPLSQELQGLARHVKSVGKAVDLSQKLKGLSTTYRCVDDCEKGSPEEEVLLKTVAQQSFDFCTPGGRVLEQTMAFYGFDSPKILENKHIRQVNKLGRYWGLCEDIAEASRKYGRVFASIDLQILTRYEPSTAVLSAKARPFPCHVHAEIQLLIHYWKKSSPVGPRPRVLGVSKAACYLCNLFILNHRQFFITRTHGKLYPFWTVPDLAEYNQNQLSDIRRVLKNMDTTIQKALSKISKGRQWPMESFIHLSPRFLTSPVASDLGTLVSGASGEPVATACPSVKAEFEADSMHKVAETLLSTPTHGKVQDSIKPSEEKTVPGLDSDTVKRDFMTCNPIDQPQLSSPLSAAKNGKESPPPMPPSGLESLNYTFQHTITAFAPAHIHVAGVDILLEIDGDSKATCKIARVSEPGSADLENAVDLQRMDPNEIREFWKDQGNDRLKLDFCASQDHIIRLSLRWE